MHRSHPFYDDENLWAKENTPSPINLKPFQKRLDQIAGKTPEGASKVRVVWAQDFDATRIFVCGEWRMHYAAWRWEDGAHLREVGRPRFVIEQLHTRAELNRKGAWDDARYSWQDGECVDVLGPAPEAFYSELFTIAHHDSFCCDGREVVGGEPCMGGYREPNDADLERVARMVRRRDAASRQEVAPTASKLRRDAEYKAERVDEARRQRIRERINDWMAVRGHNFITYDPSVAHHGKYHWLTSSSRSGLTEAERRQVLHKGPLNADSNTAGRAAEDAA